MFLRRLFGLGLLVGFLAGCQTSLVHQFEKLHPGMDKHQVLETMGSPQTSNRLHGKDRWIYVFFEDDIRFEKEVHFLNGVAIYVGEAWKPAAEASAEANDKKHDEINTAFQAEEKSREEARKNNPDMYMNYEKQVRGHDKVKYMPTFQEVK